MNLAAIIGNSATDKEKRYVITPAGHWLCRCLRGRGNQNEPLCQRWLLVLRAMPWHNRDTKGVKNMIGTNLIMLRKRYKMTQEELSERMV